MKAAIMQPYFFPYIGYFQLINSVDIFVIYDNIQYTKKGWINRNRILNNGKADYFSLPLKKDSDFLNIEQRELSIDWEKEKNKLLNKIKESYRKAPYFNEIFELIEKCINFNNKNLFEFILFSLQETLKYLSINTKIIKSSTITLDHSLKSEEKVIEICKSINAKSYINPIGGMELYNKFNFEKKLLSLHFLRANNFEYKQFNNEFVPFLSIIDVMMFNSKENLKKIINNEFNIIEKQNE